MGNPVEDRSQELILQSINLLQCNNNSKSVESSTLIGLAETEDNAKKEKVGDCKM